MTNPALSLILKLRKDSDEYWYLYPEGAMNGSFLIRCSSELEASQLKEKLEDGSLSLPPEIPLDKLYEFLGWHPNGKTPVFKIK